MPTPLSVIFGDCTDCPDPCIVCQADSCFRAIDAFCYATPDGTRGFFTNMVNWVNAYDITTIPIYHRIIAYFNLPTDTTPASVTATYFTPNLSGNYDIGSLCPRVDDSNVQVTRVQFFFTTPRNYLLLGWLLYPGTSQTAIVGCTEASPVSSLDIGPPLSLYTPQPVVGGSLSGNAIARAQLGLISPDSSTDPNVQSYADINAFAASIDASYAAHGFTSGACSGDHDYP